MNLFDLIGLVANPVGNVLGYVGKEFSGWIERRDTIREAELKAKVADIEARSQLAAYKVASEVEWDLTWAGQAGTSWKDEYILILWSVPAIVMFPCFLIPGLREYAMDTLTFFQTLNPDIMTWYMTGWGVIFAATFGMKTAVQAMVGDRVTKVVDAFSLIPADIPKAAVELAQKAVGKVVAPATSLTK